MNYVALICVSSAIGFFCLVLLGCASADRSHGVADQTTESTSETSPAEPPAQIRAWMDRLTVAHAYDPATGFIVAREVIDLPEILAASPPLGEAVQQSRTEDKPLVVFATADRCAPCQQFKKDALNDVRVVDRLRQADLLAAHIEVDREPEAAQRYLGGTGIPMTYLLRNGEVVAQLPGQRDGETLAHWLDEQLRITSERR
ncbi:MAG: thioredoxin [Phycisphaerales bacterium]|nr:MAG: thioredoxin [Phycisphaerales bacterium]